MKKVLSKQRGVKFLFCGSPVTIDKTKDWGDNNLQLFPNGAFLKINDDNTVSHGVQPNSDNTAPVGWIANGDGTFDKAPIWVDESKVYENNHSISLNTLDGKMDYVAKEPSVVVFNGNEESIDPNDSWLMEVKGLKKNYEADWFTVPAATIA